MIENDLTILRYFQHFERDDRYSPDTDWNVYFSIWTSPEFHGMNVVKNIATFLWSFNKFGEQDAKQVIDDLRTNIELATEIIRGGQFAFIPCVVLSAKQLQTDMRSGAVHAMTVALGSGCQFNDCRQMLADVVIENNGKTDVNALEI